MYLFPIKPKIALIRLGLVAGVAVACAEPKSPTPATPVLPPVTVTPHLFIQRGFSAEQNALNKQVKALEKELATTRQQQDAIQARMDGLLKETQEAGKTRAERDALQADLAKNQNRKVRPVREIGGMISQEL